MTVTKNTGAVSTQGGWDSINWDKAHCEVMKLQVRIAKATKQGRWGKVKSLQWILTHSHYGKCMAVKRVTTNKGKNTPGVDGVTLRKDSEKYRLVLSMTRRGYTPQPLRRIYIPKSGGNKKRPLGIPTMLDRSQQALYTLALEPVTETTADPNSYGFRQKRGTADAIKRLFSATSRKYDPQWVLEGDIKGCFDNISHDWLLKNVAMDRVVLRKWLKAGFIEKARLFPTEEGTPQGGIISPCLANAVLDGIERLLGEVFGNMRELYGRRPRQNVLLCLANRIRFCRYADDFVVLGASRELLEERVKPLIENFLKERGLELSQEKTKITHITEGFDFLGQNIRRYVLRSGKTKLLIKPSKKNIHDFLTSVRGTIKKMATADQEGVIRKLNPMVRGWAYYHRYVNAKNTYNKVDHEVWSALWRWAKRRHPNKGLRWVKKRYFHTINGTDWNFACKVKDAAGRSTMLKTVRISYISIVRYANIRIAANPFDPDWEAYFEQRESYKMGLNADGKRTLETLRRRQDGICPQCGKPLPKRGRIGIIHYTKSRTRGGQPTLGNLSLLHSKCHDEGQRKGFMCLLPVGTKEMSSL